MKVLGIYGSIGFDGSSKESYVHDAGATLFIDGEHLCSICLLYTSDAADE